MAQQDGSNGDINSGETVHRRWSVTVRIRVEDRMVARKQACSSGDAGST